VAGALRPAEAPVSIATFDFSCRVRFRFQRSERVFVTIVEAQPRGLPQGGAPRPPVRCLKRCWETSQMIFSASKTM
jgi:hypothetical protein